MTVVGRVLVAVAWAAVAGLTGCTPRDPGAAGPSPDSAPGGSPPAAAGAVVRSTDGLSQVRVPAGWEEIPGLNDAAVLQVGDRARKAYFVVRTFPKRDWPGEGNLGKYARDWMERFRAAFADSRVQAGPTPVTIGDRPAVQYEFAGLAADNQAETVLLHTTVSGRDHLHELVAWTNRRRIEENRPVLQAVIASFAETGGQGDK